MKSLFHSIDVFVKQHDLFAHCPTIILGLSGGPDSVFLFHLLHEYKKKGIINNFIAAHLDHQWRTGSAQDLLFCKQLADRFNIQLITASADELPAEIRTYHGSKEELGRIMRRYFLEDVRNRFNADSIALAHHAQDQEETFFIRLIRGTTLTGLVGMKPKDGVYIRPLLEINKEDILQYLETNGIAYVTDPTNVEESFLRNRIRKLVIPALEQSDERFHHNFLRTHDHLQESEAFIAQHIQTMFNKLSTIVDETIMLDLTAFNQLDQFIQNRVLLHWFIKEQIPFQLTQSYLDEVMRFLKQPGNKTHALHQDWSIVKKNNQAYIKK